MALHTHCQCDGVICGHIHTPAIMQIGELTYYNCGDWVESCTALLEYDDGRLELVRHHDLNVDAIAALKQEVVATPAPPVGRSAGCNLARRRMGQPCVNKSSTRDTRQQIDRCDTRFMTHEKCAGKRLVGAFETDWAGHRLRLRHQPNDLTDNFEPSDDATDALTWCRLRVPTEHF